MNLVLKIAFGCNNVLSLHIPLELQQVLIETLGRGTRSESAGFLLACLCGLKKKMEPGHWGRNCWLSLFPIGHYEQDTWSLWVF